MRHAGGLAEGLHELVDGAVEVLVGAAGFVDFGDGVHDGGVVLAAELTADLGEGGFGHLLCEVHGDLARDDDLAGVVLLLELWDAHAEVLGDGALDGLDGDLADLGVDELLEAGLGDGDGALDAVVGAPGDDADEGAFELAHIGADVRGDEEGDVGGDGGAFGLCFALEDGDFGFEVGGLDVGDETPLEAAAEAVLEVLELLGGAIAGDYDLFHGLVEGVEGVEELLLGALLAGEELDVVDEQDVDGAEAVAEAGHLVVADGVDHVVGELFTGDIADGGVGLAALDLVADGLHEMGLAHADAAVKEEGVVGLGRALRDGLGGGGGELVAGADDEGIELVARVELGGGVPVEAGLFDGGCLRGRGSAVALGDLAGAVGCGIGGVAGHGREAAVFTDTRRGGIVLGDFKLDIVDLEAELLDGFFDEVAVLVADVLELGRGDADEEGLSDRAGVSGWLEPGLEGLPIDLLFERTENADPMVQHGGGRRDE
jgi:hypothetical protein